MDTETTMDKEMKTIFRISNGRGLYMAVREFANGHFLVAIEKTFADYKKYPGGYKVIDTMSCDSEAEARSAAWDLANSDYKELHWG